MYVGVTSTSRSMHISRLIWFRWRIIYLDVLIRFVVLFMLTPMNCYNVELFSVSIPRLSTKYTISLWTRTLSAIWLYPFRMHRQRRHTQHSSKSIEKLFKFEGIPLMQHTNEISNKMFNISPEIVSRHRLRDKPNQTIKMLLSNGKCRREAQVHNVHCIHKGPWNKNEENNNRKRANSFSKYVLSK